MPLTFSCLSLMVSLCVGVPQEPASSSLAEVLEGIAKLHGAVDSVLIVYRSDEYESPTLPRGAFLYRSLAVKAPDLFWHRSAHGSASLDWRDDPRRQDTLVLSNHWLTFSPVNRCYFEGSIHSNEPLPGSMPYELYLLSTGLWVTTGRPTPKKAGSPLLAHDLVEDKAVRLRPHLELVADAYCHVLDVPQRETIWVDSHRGFAVMARDLYADRTDHPARRLEMTSHAEVAPGLWLPRVIRNIRYTFQNPTSGPRVAQDLFLRLELLEVNCLSKDWFVLDLPPGSLKVERDSSIQASNGGLDHLDDLVAWMRRNLPESNAPQSVIPDWVPWATLAGVGALVVAHQLRKIHRKRKCSMVVAK